MASYKLLVKEDDSSEHVAGFLVHGLTDDDAVAQAWESANEKCFSLDVNSEASISATPLLKAEKL